MSGKKGSKHKVSHGQEMASEKEAKKDQKTVDSLWTPSRSAQS
jgi:hypothetical protein